MFRASFWLAAIIVLLPASTEDGTLVPNVGVLQALTASGELVRDIGAVCDRRPQACEVAGDTLTLIGMKLATGFEIVSAAVSGDPREPPPPDTPERLATGTLTELDTEPAFSAAAAGD